MQCSPSALCGCTCCCRNLCHVRSYLTDVKKEDPSLSPGRRAHMCLQRLWWRCFRMRTTQCSAVGYMLPLGFWVFWVSHRARTCRAVLFCSTCAQEAAVGSCLLHHHPQGFVEPCKSEPADCMEHEEEALRSLVPRYICPLTHSCPHKNKSQTTTSFVWNPPAFHWGFHVAWHFHMRSCLFPKSLFFFWVREFLVQLDTTAMAAESRSCLS